MFAYLIGVIVCAWFVTLTGTGVYLFIQEQFDKKYDRM